jgi:exopolysaccharide biosynthesis polyprenyl glycosylphosphotransferase
MTNPRQIAAALLVLDIAAMTAVFDVISLLRGVGTGDSALAIPTALLVFAIYLVQGYKVQTDMLSVDYASQHSIAVLSAMLGTMLLTYAVVPAGYEFLVPQSSRFVIALSYVLLIPLTISYRRLIYLRVLATRGERSVIFLGDHASCLQFREECGKMGMRQPIIFTSSTGGTQSSFSSQSDLVQEAFETVLKKVESGSLAIEAIVLRESARELPAGVSQRLVQLYFSGFQTYTLELFHQVYWQKIPVYRINQTWLFQEGFEIAREPVFERLKRVADIALAGFGLLLAAPLILASAIAIWLEDRGPIFFAQTRIGRNHQPFRLLKLRSMRVARAGDDLYTQPGDTRITKVGGFLRTSRLDELPQLWNVLRGDMSLIGPRAEWDRLVTNYEREIPCYHFRHLVKPGITGWAQVNYPYGANLEDTVRKLEYDLYYIRHFSFLLDATIVLKTIHIMLFGKGR